MARESKLESLIEPVVRELGYELVGVELLGQGRQSLLRIYIDTPEGITVDDCERVSRQVSALLDVEDPIRGEYTLEVSSPGLDRPLFKTEDFTRFSGHQANIRLAAPIEGRRKFKGVLLGVEDERVIVEAEGERFLLPLNMIEKANLVPDV